VVRVPHLNDTYRSALLPSDKGAVRAGPISYGFRGDVPVHFCDAFWGKTGCHVFVKDLADQRRDFFRRVWIKRLNGDRIRELQTVILP
jgi:hypothetical protein